MVHEVPLVSPDSSLSFLGLVSLGSRAGWGGCDSWEASLLPLWLEQGAAGIPNATCKTISTRLNTWFAWNKKSPCFSHYASDSHVWLWQRYISTLFAFSWHSKSKVAYSVTHLLKNLCSLRKESCMSLMLANFLCSRRCSWFSWPESPSHQHLAIAKLAGRYCISFIVAHSSKCKPQRSRELY